MSKLYKVSYNLGRYTFKTQHAIGKVLSNPGKAWTDYTNGYKMAKAESSDDKFKQQLQADTELMNQCMERIAEGSPVHSKPVQAEMDI